MTSNPPQAEFNEDDDFDEERKQYGQQPRSQKGGAAGQAKSKTPVLDNFGRDITRLAESGSLDPIVGRENEIERVSQILSAVRKTTPF